MNYTHLSLAERQYIEIERNMGKSLSNIAFTLGRSQSILSREIKRNTGRRGYRHKQATSFTMGQHTHKKKAVKMTADKKELISEFIREEWSSEQVAGKFKDDGVISIHYSGSSSSQNQ